MSVKPRPLFSDGPVQIERDRALEAIDAAVSRLTPAQLEDPSLPARLADRCLPRPPKLGERARYWLFESSTIERDLLARPRVGWAVGVEVTIPFRGSADFFSLRAGVEPFDSPEAVVRPRSLVLSALGQQRDAAALVADLDDQLKVVRRELEEQRQQCEAMRDDLEGAARDSLAARRRRLAVLTGVGEAFSARGWPAKRARS